MNKLALNIHPIQNQIFGITFLSLFHLIGLVGILSGPIPWILSLTPFNLLLAVGIMLFFHPKWDIGTVIFILLCYMVGLVFEIIGVNTGIIFGQYAYGPVLGWKLLETPLIIGVNWLLLIYSSSSLINILFQNTSKIVKALLAAILMVILDIIIEPVAIHLNFWQWEAASIPIQNYIAWFLISLMLTVSFQYLLGSVRNKVGAGLFIIQVLFFTLLLLFKV